MIATLKPEDQEVKHILTGEEDGSWLVACGESYDKGEYPAEDIETFDKLASEVYKVCEECSDEIVGDGIIFRMNG